MQSGGFLNVSSTLTIAPSTTLVVVLGSNVPTVNGQNLTVAIASYSSNMGTFQSVNVTTSTIATTTDCVILNGAPVYGSATLNVIVSASPCASQGLSTGAIIGIAVGAAVGGLLLAALIVFAIYKGTQTRTQNMKKDLKDQELREVKK